MLSKVSHLNYHPANPLAPVFLLSSPCPFQLNSYARNILSSWRQKNPDNDVEVVELSNSSDWLNLPDKANSYSLFNATRVIDARYDKKNLEATAKVFFDSYLQEPNFNTLLIIRAPHLSLKVLQPLATLANLQIIFGQTLSEQTIKQWIGQQLIEQGLSYSAEIPDLIYQFNENNLLGCAQVIEKLKLVTEKNEKITAAELKNHLSNQSDFSLYELSTTCLVADANKSLILIQQCRHNKTEPTLVLWVLTQEVRTLLQLKELMNKGISWQEATSRLKIWANKAGFYKQAAGRYSINFLVDLLKHCELSDRQIKTGSGDIWQSLELLALALCLGEKVGYFA